MKKILLSFGVACAVYSTNAQVVLNILEPASSSGTLFNEYVDIATWPLAPDMEDPANAFTDTLMLADDSLSCTTLTNDLTGKIAVIYRGSCEFGTKALNAQNAGAVGAIIINPGGAPINMGAGTDGPNVSIPVTMISASDGAIIQQAFDNGETIVAFWGAQYGVNANDLGIDFRGVVVPQYGGVVADLAQNDTEFDVPLGTWVYNYGSNDRFGVTVTADIEMGGNSVYNNSAGPVDILAGDSAYFTLPTFSQTSYSNGEYTISYSVGDATSTVDDLTSNDTYETEFVINDEYYSVVPLDPTTGFAKDPTFISPPRSTNSTDEALRYACVVLKNSNASRKAIRGVSFAASTYDPIDPTTLAGDFLEFRVYEWNDVFTDLNDPNFAISNLNEVSYAEFYYDTDDQEQNKYVEFDDAVVMVDDQRYAVCLTTYTPALQIGFNNNLVFDETSNVTLEPNVMLGDDAGFYIGLNGFDAVPGLVVKTMDAAAADVEENTVDITPFPNPTEDIINIPMAGVKGMAALTVTDLTGKLVQSQTLNVENANQVSVDLTELPAGIYVFNMTFENGATSTFNVAVTK